MSITPSEHQFVSYWQTTTQPLPLASALPSSHEVVIIGGGILGAGACYWLARQGVKPLLLEQTAPASGATGRNGGFLSLGPAVGMREAEARYGAETAHTLLRITRENQALVQQIVEEEEIDCEYTKPGSIHLALDEQQWKALSQEAEALRAAHVQTSMLDRTHLQAFIDTSLGEEILGGRLCLEEGLLYPLKLVHGLLHAAQRYGASIAKARVVQLSSAKGTVTLETVAGSLSAKKVLVATNAWIGELLPPFARLVVPVRGQMLSYAPIPSVFATGMAASLSSTGDYWQQRPDGTILLGGCRTAAVNKDEGITDSNPSQEVQAALERVLPRLFPHLNPLQVQQRWAGLMAFTPDLLPLAGQAPDFPGCWGVGGFCGHGMPFGIRVSQLLAEAMLNETAPADLAIFRLDRPTLSSE